MSWRIAESLKKLREQINAAYPNRDKASDGGIGDERHASSTSDHNPWIKDSKGQGVVSAIDIDEDLTKDIHSIQFIVDAIIASRDRRVKYIIYEGRMCSSYPAGGYKAWQWRPYSGTKNPHRHHAHISVNAAPVDYDNRADWSIGNSPARKIVEEPVVLEIPSVEVKAASSAVLGVGVQSAEVFVPVVAEVSTEVSVDAPQPTGFLSKIKAQGLAALAFIGGGAGLKEWFNVQISPETIGLLKILVPTVLVLGFVGFLVWFVSEKIVGFKTLKMQAEYATDPTRHNLVINRQ